MSPSDVTNAMSEYKLDLRDVPPPNRHPVIMKDFEEVESGGVLTLVSDHEPKPLYHQMKEEVPESDADSHEAETKGAGKLTARLPKR